jgi:hypothetical protein
VTAVVGAAAVERHNMTSAVAVAAAAPPPLAKGELTFVEGRKT